MEKPHLEFGCGLIRIGRVWGVDAKEVPTESEALTFLHFAFQQGIRFFDTAPAYGLSELRLGKFLKQLSNEQRDEVIIATKMGEHWNSDLQDTFVDHSYSALKKSIHTSMERLGKISVLQLHKASPALLLNDDVARAFEYAKLQGIDQLGTSVSDNETGLKSCEDDRFAYIQLPYNQERTELLPVITKANQAHKKILFNRPLAMGAVVHKTQRSQAILDAFSFINQAKTKGILLSGTASIQHLEENIKLFEQSVCSTNFLH